ncbi:hypothetical protein D3C81_1770810 [compost metagenome]
MTLASIDNNQVRSGQIFLQHPFVSAPDDLAHRIIIVRAFNGADFIFSVFLLGRLAIDEYDHRRDRIRSLNVGIIKRLDPRQIGKSNVLA